MQIPCVAGGALLTTVCKTRANTGDPTVASLLVSYSARGETGNLQVCSLTARHWLVGVCRVVDGITNPSISAFLAAVAVSTVPQRRQRAILLLWRRGVQVIAKRRAAAMRRLHDVSLYSLNDCAEIFFRYTPFSTRPAVPDAMHRGSHLCGPRRSHRFLRILT